MHSSLCWSTTYCHHVFTLGTQALKHCKTKDLLTMCNNSYVTSPLSTSYSRYTFPRWHLFLLQAKERWDCPYEVGTGIPYFPCICLSRTCPFIVKNGMMVDPMFALYWIPILTGAKCTMLWSTKWLWTFGVKIMHPCPICVLSIYKKPPPNFNPVKFLKLTYLTKDSTIPK